MKFCVHHVLINSEFSELFIIVQVRDKVQDEWELEYQRLNHSY